MTQALRHPAILDLARRDGKVTVDGLAAHFGVTLQTIRRDLTDLAESGRLERVHGGAVLPSGTTNIDYQERRNLQRSSKAEIADICATLIPNGSCLFLGIGTTCEAIAGALTQHENLLVITNNMNVANLLSGHRQAEIIVTGGTLRKTDGGLVGNVATRIIEQFKFDVAFIGCSALDDDGDVLDFDIQEVAVSQTILKQSRQVYLASDQSKFLRKAPIRVANLKDLTGFISDAPPPSDLSSACISWGTDIYLTDCS
ncbi:DeoR/GlpR family DNA-binding transcription regulator [Aestuariibius sp. HNIBRBA575]|uniref:DeoR/GlpR family DNA-binding transcription regulator n=1 Tax=Aestuariibius sp. HNIBRBA575 TaxID=3233343 RepID=UPI0034A3A746